MMPAHKFKFCAKCEKDKPPEGGVDMSPTRWICMPCWVKRAAVPPKKKGSTSAHRSQ